MARPPARRPKAGKPKSDPSPLEPSDVSDDQLDLDADADAEADTDVEADAEIDAEADVDADDAEADADADVEDEVDADVEDEVDLDIEGGAEGDIRRSKGTDSFWAKVNVEPVELALPSGAGYTLRAYRLNTEVTPTDYTAREDADFPDRTTRFPADLDDEFREDDDELEDEVADVEDIDNESDEDQDDELDDEDDDEDEDADADDEDAVLEEEVPLFLSHAGHLLLFRTRAGLVDFITSDAEHDLMQLKGWSKVATQVRPEHIVALPDETYELDLIVKNLRAGHETWDPDLIVKSGQVARDLGHALRIESVVMALSPGSPLDDLDEALRAVAEGGVGSFFARRKAKKIGKETASIGWRTVIGKISAVVDWRD